MRVRPRASRGCWASPFPAATIDALFGRLGVAFSRAGDDFLVTPPSYRFDLAIEEDFVEEIARLHGFDAIPATVVAAAAGDAARCRSRTARHGDQARLVARGWQEAITFSFVSSAWETTLFPARDASAAPDSRF